LLRLGVPVIAASGNRGADWPSGYPARFAIARSPYHDAAIADLIVVGRGFKDGHVTADRGDMPKSDGPEGVDIWAPGQDLRCPNGEGGMRDDASGTSYGESIYHLHSFFN
jgi:hypothetical protein